MCRPLLTWSFRRKLLEARRTKDDYNSAKGDYDRARKKFQAVLDAWIPQEWTQIEDHHSLLERVETMISQEAYRCIGQAIEKTLQDWRLGATPSEDGDLGCAPRGAFADEKGVSVLEYPDLTRYTQSVSHRVSRY